MRVTIKNKLLLSHFVAIIIVSGSVGTFFYYSAVDSLLESLKSRLKYSAALLSRTLDAGKLEGLRSSADMAHPDYQLGLSMLREFQATNRDIAFIYVMRKEGDRVEFVIDSDSSSRQAHPGQVYAERVDTLNSGFRTVSVDEAITRDEWGYFLSGYAPLKNGEGRYLVGLDMRADEVQSKFRAIQLAGILSLAISVLLAWGFSMVLARRITRPIRGMVIRAGEIAEGNLEGRIEADTNDELSELANAFNRMSALLALSQEETRTTLVSLKEARDTLETRVVERTAELEAVNDELFRENAERKRAEEALQEAASTDYLTGLCNRPALLHLIEKEGERVKRSGARYSLILADIDFFKEINDQCGHEAGDLVLKKIAVLMEGAVRAQDSVARWGGDEIMLFLPETPVEGARDLAAKLLAVISGTSFEACGKIHHLTLSMGVAASQPGMPVNDCIRLADKALYQAKAAGRNRVAVTADCLKQRF